MRNKQVRLLDPRLHIMSQEQEMESESSEHERQSEEEAEPKGTREILKLFRPVLIIFFTCSAGDSDYLPPEEAAAQQQQRRTSVSNLTSPLKSEAAGEYDQKLVRFPIRALYN